MTDPIADMIIRIKNGLLAGKSEVNVPHSKLKQAIAAILVKEGYLADSKVSSEGTFPHLVLTLKYQGKTPAITNVKRLSKPGRRFYANTNALPKTLGGYGITIISTSKGVMTDSEARQQHVGGEVLCQIW